MKTNTLHTKEKKKEDLRMICLLARAGIRYLENMKYIDPIITKRYEKLVKKFHLSNCENNKSNL